MKEQNIYLVMATAIGFAALGFIYGQKNHYLNLGQPILQVEEGYIDPAKLEIKCRDLDGNGKAETLMKINDIEYLLREADGKPVISKYKVKPKKTIPAKIIFEKKE